MTWSFNSAIATLLWRRNSARETCRWRADPLSHPVLARMSMAELGDLPIEPTEMPSEKC